jgi:site-specific DNA-cytosine methylase
MAALVMAAFVAGRWTKPKDSGAPAASVAQVRERVLVVAVGEHLGKSEMVLMELANATPPEPGQKQINISAEQRRAEDLLDANRLYRETAQHDGDAALASVLDDLERVLLDVAHSPQELTPAKLESLQKRIEAHGILFKVRVVGKELQEKQKQTNSAPAQTGSEKRERNKA